MTDVAPILAGVTVMALAAAAAVARQARRRNLHKWVGPHLRQRVTRRLRPAAPLPDGLDVFICIADHFEPHAGGAADAVADARVAAWVDGYAAQLGGFRDSSGRPPQHTFFYPIDQYVPRHVDALAGLCRQGFGEVELHLHHDHDTAENLEATLQRFADLFASRHGLLGRHRSDGRVAYGFVHGNWALDNGRPDGRWCGVDDELSVLRRTGCYADFTFPSAPDVTQPPKVNAIYYAVGGPGRRRSHDRGIDVGTAPMPAGGLMVIQGPLRLWRPPGQVMPRVENGCLQRGQPPTEARLDQWVRAGVGVAGRPGWRFVKLHTHGATEGNRAMLLGEATLAFHRSLARRAAADRAFRFHYVTAREMWNLVKAAEAGWAGPIAGARDFAVLPATGGNSGARATPHFFKFCVTPGQA